MEYINVILLLEVAYFAEPFTIKISVIYSLLSFSENLALDQMVIPKLIFFTILLTCLLDFELTNSVLVTQGCPRVFLVIREKQN